MFYTRTRVNRVRRAQKYHINKRPRKTNLINPLFVVGLFIVFFLVGSLAGVHFNSSSVEPQQVLAATSVPDLYDEPDPIILPEPKEVSSDLSYVIDPKLQIYMENWVKTNNKDGKNWSVYVQGLKGDNRVAMYNANQQFKIASLYKLFLVKPLSLRLPPSKWSTQKTKSGKTYLQCVNDMLQFSDNSCAENITNYIGNRKIDNQLKTDSYLNTTFSKKINTMGTARDTAAVLERMYTSQEYDLNTRNIVLDALKNQKYREGIPNICKTSCTVYNKTGELDGYLNDAAIVESPNTSYVVVIISNGGKWNEISSLAKGIHNHMMP